MEYTLDVVIEQPLILETVGMVYRQKPHWCDGAVQTLPLSLLRPRRYFPYDPPRPPLPCVVWVCGGGWTEVDPNVWLPELTWLAKAGYAVASVSYSLAPARRFPEPLQDIKAAIRFLRANAARLGIDPERIAVMGESAGGHYAALVGATGDLKQFRTEEYAEQSDAVKAAVTYYPCVDMLDYDGRGETASYAEKPQCFLRAEFVPQGLLGGFVSPQQHPQQAEQMDPCHYVGESTPPFLILHGTGDTLVPIHHSEKLYGALTAAKRSAEFIRVRGAEHADWRFYQEPIHQRVLKFLQENV